MICLFVSFHFNLLFCHHHYFSLRWKLYKHCRNYIPYNLIEITNTTYTKCALSLIIAVWLCLLLFIYLHTVNYIIVFIHSYSLQCYIPHNGIVLFLGGIIFWYWIFILLKVLPSFTVISCTQLFVLQNLISSCSVSCYHFRTYDPAHIKNNSDNSF